MKILKALALSVLSLFLFLSLFAFGLAFTAKSTVLNPGFVSAQADRLDLSSLVDETLTNADQSQLPAGVQSTIVGAVHSLEPQIKTQLTAAISEIYDYSLGKTPDIDLSAVLKSTVLNKSLITSMVDQADITTAAENSLRDQLVALIPPGQQELQSYIDQAMPSIEPWLKEQIDAATGPVIDYLVGDSPTLNVVIPLDQMKTILRASLHDAFVKSPPPELAGATPAQLDAIFSQAYDMFASQVPSSAVIDPASLGLSGPLISQHSMADAQARLAQAKTAIGQFRVYYVLLIIFMALLVTGIILVHREVKGATLNLGIVFLVYGALALIGAFVSQGVINLAIKGMNLPAALLWLPGWLSVFVADAFWPMEILSIGLAVGGIALIIVSAAYRPRSASV